MTEYWVIVALIFGCTSAADFCQYPYECVAIGYCSTWILTDYESTTSCNSNQHCCLNANGAWWLQAGNNYQAAPTTNWQQNSLLNEDTTPFATNVNYNPAVIPRNQVGNYYQNTATTQRSREPAYFTQPTPAPFPRYTSQRIQTELNPPERAPVQIGSHSNTPIEASLLNDLCGLGNQSGPGQYPWVVALFSRYQYFGGGSLIAPGVVLTAAHLLPNKNANEIVVRAGEWDMSSDWETFRHEERVVKKIERHEEFVFGKAWNDMALLYLQSPFELKAHIRTICLPRKGRSFDHKRCIMAGWGKPSYQDPQNSKKQKQVELPMVMREECQNKLRRTSMGRDFNLHESLICAGGERDQDACTGDGGSPLFCPLENDPNRYEQAGIVSFGIRCGQENVPGTFTNVALFRDYIDLKLAGGKFDL
ncbi:phenoloxidase-activating factor 2-like [Drosophila subpulchrella]|uniref:phenoloxidase-activating factor 2-like n=1 Tax=Drosophila subpulchrella TaxID=1486046 RepID=UPI0018A13E59|nr:phenoloxidase-activating factor 2-like [Drosophila subpulchrella]